MKRMTWAVILLVGFAAPVRAQMGMNMFTKPSFTKIFHPVVGQGAEYESTNKIGSDTKPHNLQMGIVGKESVEGKDGYWLQSVIETNNGQIVIAKMLMTGSDFQSYRVIIQTPGQPAMEMPVSTAGANRGKVVESMEDWHSVGTDTVTVPAGTYSCEHWKNDKTGGEVWTSDKVSPIGVVKEMSKDHTMVLMKVLSGYPDRITGPVQKFDPQVLMQQMQQQRQRQPQQ